LRKFLTLALKESINRTSGGKSSPEIASKDRKRHSSLGANDLPAEGLVFLHAGFKAARSQQQA
jgi:hypothetical protein